MCVFRGIFTATAPLSLPLYLTIYIYIYIYMYIFLGKSWTAIDWQSIIWESDLSDKSKWNFFQAAFV